MKMKKSLSLLLTVFAFLLASCSNWMKDDNLYSDIEKDVKVANASKITVYVRYAMTRQGKTDPDGSAIFKVGIPHEISATTETEFGFVRWAAFTTDFLATGDNQSKNKDFLFVDEEDYNTRFLPNEIQSPTVVFEDPTSPTTKVTINQKRDDLFLVPIVTQRPAVALTIPARGSGGVVRNMSVRINFTKPMDEESFKNSEGVFDTITITQGTQTFTSEGDIEIDSEDITSRFQNPVFSKNKKMITLQFKDSEVEEGYASQSSVTITISKEVKDLYGFTMVDDEKISFTVGSNKDTLAPRITLLTGGNGKDFAKFRGMYEDKYYMEGTANQKLLTEFIGQKTKMKYGGAKNAPTDDVEAAFFGNFGTAETSNFYANRVGEKIIIRVYAEDIAGSGEGQSSDGIETDVSVVGVRAKLLYNMNGDPSTQALGLTSYSYMPQVNQTSIEGAYKDLVTASYNLAGSSVENDEKLESSKGTLIEYDLKGLDDGLIQIDVAAVDLISNSGFAAGGAYSSEYGNGYASLFVVKDTKAPSLIAQDGVSFKFNQGNGSYSDVDFDKFYNSTEKAKLTVIGNSIPDAGHERLRSRSVQWIVQPAEDQISTTTGNWVDVSTNFSNFNIGNVDKVQQFKYVLKDDLGNTAAAVLPEQIKFDCTNPAIGEMTWQVATGSTAGITKGNILTDQTLVIPITEATSGIKKLEISVDKEGGVSGYGPLDSSISGFEIYINGVKQTSSLNINSTDKKTITITSPVILNAQDIKIYNLRIANDDANNNYDGRYTVKVKVTDDANNVSTVASKVLSNDSTKPVIKNVVVPAVNKTRSFTAANGTDYEYWISLTDPNDTATLEVTFQEENSGAKIFSLNGTNSSLSFAAGVTNVYKVANGIETQIATESIDAKTITIAASDVDKLYDSTNDVKVKITGVSLASSVSDPDKIKLTVSDTAKNVSGAKEQFTLKDTTDVNYSSFNHYTTKPSFSSLELFDRSPIPVAAQTDYTNENIVNAYIKSADSGSGVYSLTAENAVFVKDSTVITFPGTNGSTTTAAFEIPGNAAEGSTVVFKSGDLYGLIKGTKTITVSNLKISDATDGNQTVYIKVHSIDGLTSDKKDDSITLDTNPPHWVNKGLYTQQYRSAVIYPHPDSTQNYGISLGTKTDPNDPNSMDELYFYQSDGIIVAANAVDDDEHFENVYWEGGNISGNHVTQGAINGGLYGTFNAYAYDKAGNKSKDIKFNVVKVSSVFTSGNTRKNIVNLEHDVQLIAPTGGDVAKNTFLNYARTTMPWSENYDYFGSSQSNAIYAYNYVLKQFGEDNDNPVNYDDRYKLKINISGYAGVDTESPPIEQYAVTHNYGTFPSEADGCSGDPYVPRLPENSQWNNYNKTDHAVKTNGDLRSYIDNNGDIIVILPNHSCPPVSLYLMDGCGNKNFILLNPNLKATLNTYLKYPDLTLSENLPSAEKNGKRNQAVAWYFDNEVGLGTYSPDSHTSYTAEDGVISNCEDITYYNNTGSLDITNQSDVCRYPTATSLTNNTGVTNITSADANHYTMRSRIIVWTENSDPQQADFYEETNSNLTGQNASAWKYGIETDQPAVSGRGDTSFDLVYEFPKYYSETAYKLYYIVEDTVGNCIIRPLKRDITGSLNSWMYDATAPVLNVTTPEKVNNILTSSNTRINYYSINSFVNYQITDSQSGIRNLGGNSVDIAYDSPYRYSYTPESGLSLSGINPENGKISISGVKDWAGNEAASVGLKYNNSTTWVKQTAPVLIAGSTSDVKTEDHSEWGTWGLLTEMDSNNSNHYKVTATAYRQKLSIQLKAKWLENGSETSYTTSSSTNKLLGWVISDNALSDNHENPAYKFKDFYTPSDVTKIGEGNGETYNKYTFVKTSNTPWKDYFGTYYFYPVSRSGLICKTPIIVEFLENKAPALNGDITHVNIGAYTGSPKTNYIRSGAQLKFTTNNVVLSKCEIVLDSENGNTKTTFEGTKLIREANTFNYTLNLSELGTNISNKALYLKLYSPTEYSATTYSLTRPSGNNNWTYDATAPDFAYADTKVAKGNEDGNLYYDSTAQTYFYSTDTVKVQFNYSSDDIAAFEMKLQKEGDTTTADYESMSLSTNKRCTLSNLEEGKLYTCTFRAVDRAGNEKVLSSIKIFKDKTGPAATITGAMKKTGGTSATEGTDYQLDNGVYYYNNNVIGSFQFALTSLSDGSGSGLKRVYYKVDDGDEVNLTNSESYTKSITLAADATSTCSVYLEDNLGNLRTIKTYNFNGKNPGGTITPVGVSGSVVVNESTVYYNSTTVSSLTFNTSELKDARGNKVSLYLGSATEPFVENADLSGSFTLSSLSAGTCKITAKDSIGNKREFNFTLNCTQLSGSISPASVTGSVSVSGSTIYYNSSLTSLTFNTTSLQDASGGKVSLYLNDATTPFATPDATGTFTITPTAGSCKITAKDFVGYTKEFTFTLVCSAPSGEVGDYTLKKGDNNVTLATATTLGDYIVDSEGTIIYNPNSVNKFVLPVSNVSDNGAGSSIIVSDGTTPATYTKTTTSITITLGTDWTSGKTYTISVKDNVGNETIIGTYNFKADVTGPALPSSKFTFQDGANKTDGYTARKPDGNGGYTTVTSIPVAKDNQIGENYYSLYYSSGLQIMFPVSDFTDTTGCTPIKYQFATSVQTSDTNKGYTATASNDAWLNMSKEGANYVFAVPDIETVHTHLALFLKDVLGNTSVYYIGGIDDRYKQWWLLPADITASDIIISSVTLLNDSSKTGWQGVTNDYLVSVKLPKRGIVHSVSLLPAATGNNTGVVFATGGNDSIKYPIEIKGYTFKSELNHNDKAWKGSDMGTDGWIILTDDTDVAMTLKIYVWNNIAQADVKLVINGNSIDIFPASNGGGNHNRISTTPFSGKIDTSKLAGGADLAATQITTVQGYGITMNKSFDVESAIDLNSGSTTRAAKKAAKKAAKAAKSAAKATKKTGEKTTTETPVVQEIAEQVAEIAELTEIADLAEMTEIADVEKLTASDEVAMILPKTANVESVQVHVVEGPVTVQAEETVPAPAAHPKAVLIVVLLAILSSLAGVWYYKKERIK